MKVNMAASILDKDSQALSSMMGLTKLEKYAPEFVELYREKNFHWTALRCLNPHCDNKAVLRAIWQRYQADPAQYKKRDSFDQLVKDVAGARGLSKPIADSRLAERDQWGMKWLQRNPTASDVQIHAAVADECKRTGWPRVSRERLIKNIRAVAKSLGESLPSRSAGRRRTK